MTTPAASSGVCPQPLISKSTIRKSAAVSDADTSPSATFAGTSGRSAAGMISGRCSERGMNTNATNASGTWTAKIAFHEMVSVRMPPIAGPAAAPITPAADQTAIALPLTAGRRRQQLERRADGCRPTDGLDTSRRQKPREARGDRTAQRCGRKHDQPHPAKCGRGATAGEVRGGHRHDGEHEVEKGQHPRDVVDRDVVVDEDLRQREDDDRRVGEHHRNCQAQSECRSPRHPSSGAGRAFGAAVVQQVIPVHSLMRGRPCGSPEARS